MRDQADELVFELIQLLKLVVSLLELGEQLGIFDGHRRLAGQYGEDLHLILAEIGGMGIQRVEQALRLSPRGQRKDDPGPCSQALQFSGNAGILSGVADHPWPAVGQGPRSNTLLSIQLPGLQRLLRRKHGEVIFSLQEDHRLFRVGQLGRSLEGVLQNLL